MIPGVFKYLAVCRPGKIPVVVVNLFKAIIVDSAGNPLIKGRLAFISEHFQADGNPQAGFLQSPDDRQLGHMVLPIAVMFAHQDNSVFFKIGQRLRHQQLFFLIEVIQAAVSIVLTGRAAGC